MQPDTILLVAEAAEHLSAITRLIKPAADTVITAKTKKEALAKLAKTPVVLLVVYIAPTGNNGFEIAERITDSLGRKTPPILFISSQSLDAEAQAKAYRHGAVGYIPEDTHPDIITAQIAYYISIEKQKRSFETASAELRHTLEQLQVEINERKRTENALRESQQKFQSLSNNSPDIIYTVDLEGCFTFVNPAWKKILGHDEDEVIGKYFTDFAQPEDAAEYRTRFKKIRDEQHIFSDIKGTLIHRDSSPRLFSLSGAPNLDADNNVTGIVGLMKDVTEQEQLQSQLLHAQKMEAIGTLAGGVAHDFNNLLQGIAGYTDLLLLDCDEDSPAYPDLQEIRKTTRKGADLTRQLLTFSRKVESELRPISINNEIEKLRKLLERTLPKMIEIKLVLTKEPGIINADPGQFEQILMNLAVNARDAMPDGGALTLKTQKTTLDKKFCRTHVGATPGDYYQISVIDTGTGMDKQTLEHIFEPFFTTKTPRKGTGLGLSIVYGIVKSHGGYISCESRPGKGSTFKLYFPVVDRDVNTEDTTGLQKADILLSGTETVLVVDDDDIVREAGIKMFERLGYTVFAASSGEEALDTFRLRHAEIDLVILDINMPGMGGRQCLNQMITIDPESQIIITTGYSFNDKDKKRLLQQSKGFIAKPYTTEALLRIARQVLENRRAPQK